MIKKIISIAIALAIPAITLAYFQPATLTNGVNKVAVYTQEQANKYFGLGYSLDGAFGATPGPVNTVLTYFRGGLVSGGGVVTFTATATQAAKTMPISWVKDYNQVDVAAVQGVPLTLTLPSTTSLASVLPKIGDTKEVYLRNLNAAATTTTIAAGAGVDLRMGEETGADVVINGLNNANLIFKRVSSSVVSVIVNEDVVGD